MWRVFVVAVFRVACFLGVDVPWGSWLGRQYIGAMFRRAK